MTTQAATTETPSGATAAGTTPSSESGQPSANGAGAPGSEQQPTLEQLISKVEELSAGRQQDQLVIRSLHERLSEKETVEEEEVPEPVDPLADLTEEQLAGMSNRDLLKTAVAVVTKGLETTLLPQITKQLGQISNTVADQAAQKQVADAASRIPDFWDYKAQMVALSAQPKYANLGAEDLYVLAKSRSGKSGTAAAPASSQPASLPRATTGAPQKTEAQKAQEAAAMTEKPGAGAAAGTTQKSFATPEEAADDAFAKVFGKK